jgi:glycosyltransferase involved in cell wall biosynthesis
VSDTYVPGDGDTRELGVAVGRLSTVGSPFARRWPWLLLDPDDTAYLAAYDLVLTNSEFTREWVRRLWHVDAAVLFPPIRVDGIVPAASRDRTIVTVGRFFPPGSGHAKRQLEMVRVFGDLSRAGRLDGWALHVVGGCEPRGEAYLASVRAAAAGLPVEVHANAPRDVVESLLSRGSVFWSATGLGESADRAPWNQEHFGMTTVEAMAGGCVPVVIDRAGQREIVRDGVDGFRWSTPAALGDRTVQVANDETLRARLAASAVARAAEFSDAAFERRWHDVAARLL